MLATASAQVCVPLGHSSLYLFIFEIKKNIYMTSLIEPELLQLCKGPRLILRGTKRMKLVKEVEVDILLAQMRSRGTPEMRLSVLLTIMPG